MSARPNILLVFTDQQRFDTIRALGSNFGAETPNMDFLAREGIVFENCCCTGPICSPSRATILTGLFPSQAGMPGNLYAPCPPLSPTIPTLGNYARQAGYETAYHGKWHLGGGDVRRYGFEVGAECSYDTQTVQEAARFWRDRDWLEHERPFLHVVSLLNPHDHYFYDPAERVPGFRRPWPNVGAARGDLAAPARTRAADWPEERWGAYFRFYREQIERADRDLGELLHQFRCSGFFNNSWIVFCSDHGDMAGEHDIPFKGPFMYEGVVRVPLIVVPPMTRFGGADRQGLFRHNLAPGRRAALCSLLDLAPTLLDLMGLPKPERLSGVSLLPLVRGETDAAHEHVFAEWHGPALRMVRSARMKYVRHPSGAEELFDLAQDPHETRNLAASPDRADAKAALSARLDRHLAETGDPFADLDRHEFVFDPKRWAQPATIF